MERMGTLVLPFLLTTKATTEDTIVCVHTWITDKGAAHDVKPVLELGWPLSMEHTMAIHSLVSSFSILRLLLL